MFGQTTISSDVRSDGQLVGTEEVVTPAGKFNAQHYKGSDWESWIAPNVPVWGLVKSRDASGEMTLLRTVTDVPDRIKGKVQTLDIPAGFQLPTGRGR